MNWPRVIASSFLVLLAAIFYKVTIAICFMVGIVVVAGAVVVLILSIGKIIYTGRWTWWFGK